MRLSALLPIEDELMRKLLPDNVTGGRDVCVRAGSGWKGVLAALSSNSSTLDIPRNPQPPPLVSAMKGASRPGTGNSQFKDKDNPSAVLAACRDDIVTLWEDTVVQAVLKKQNVRLQDMPGLCVHRSPHWRHILTCAAS